MSQQIQNFLGYVAFAEWVGRSLVQENAPPMFGKITAFNKSFAFISS